ncbi:hypothetical protein HDU89_002589 [Geranomyces variabilis]|nr:hypothetical protein HDU89_002589 [Geranomyces variabilis]
MDQTIFCKRCTAAGKTVDTAPYHRNANNKLSEFYPPRKKRKRSSSRTEPIIPPSSATTRLQWWDDAQKQEYQRWWRPHEPPVGMACPTSTTLHRMPRRRKGLLKDIPSKSYDSWFHHRRYLYPSDNNTIQKVERRAPLPPVKAKPPTQRNRKPSGGRQRSKRTVPDEHVQRTWKLRIFPTRQQRPTLKLWMKAIRATWNWALGVLRKQYKTHGKTFVSTTSFEGLKKNFVT